ncbi:hypothetical protein CGRA01v4_05011 [Colletotrichum graminicola]|nr:hypothetical protein CGRA01v4_05011 [Colletotrichum graminicola]
MHHHLLFSPALGPCLVVLHEHGSHNLRGRQPITSQPPPPLSYNAGPRDTWQGCNHTDDQLLSPRLLPLPSTTGLHDKCGKSAPLFDNSREPCKRRSIVAPALLWLLYACIAQPLE